MAVKHTDDGDSCCFLCDKDCVYLYLCRNRYKFGCHSGPVNDDDPSLGDLDTKDDI